MSILNQTLLPYEIILVDDNEKKDFYKIETSKVLLELMILKGVKFSYYHGQSKGQVHAQQIALEHCTTDWIYKMDDDNFLDPMVLEHLSMTIKDDNTAAVSGLIIGCDLDKPRLSEETEPYNKIENVFSHFNIQMCGGQSKEIKKVEHIYSNYLFRKKFVETYPLEFSPAGHREDTVFTYQLFHKGYDLFINPNAVIYHIHYGGGNKLHGFQDVVKNEELFIKRLELWKVVPDRLTIIRKEKLVYAEKDGGEFLIYSGGGS
jgi:glycosyltransferase involved in cell wall biosynthesis